MLKDTLQRRFVIKKVKNTVSWTYAEDGEENRGTWYEREPQKKLINKNLELKKSLRKKLINYMSS